MDQPPSSPKGTAPRHCLLSNFIDLSSKATRFSPSLFQEDIRSVYYWASLRKRDKRTGFPENQTIFVMRSVNSSQLLCTAVRPWRPLWPYIAMGQKRRKGGCVLQGLLCLSPLLRTYASIVPKAE